MADLTVRSLEGHGTDESVWVACSELRRLGPCSVRPPESGRVVVISPHPDDEVSGAGGTTAAMALRGARVVVIAVTDGEASNPGQFEELRELHRSEEIGGAAARLGTTPSLSSALGLPDGHVQCSRRRCLCWSRFSSPVTLSSHRGRTMVIPITTRWVRPHTGRVPKLVQRLLAYLVWAWHWAQPGELPWETACRVELADAVARRKRWAVQCFASQLTGPEPILSSHTVRRLKETRGVPDSMTLQAPYFDRLYSAEPDPWGFRSRPYEARKRAVTLACLPEAHYSTAFRAGVLHQVS